jgi:hypothetical protein
MANGFVNPGSSGPNDLSDIQYTTPAYSEVTPQQLPIRGEKRIIPSQINLSSLQSAADAAIQQQGGNPSEFSSIQLSDFTTTASTSPFVDYMFIRIPHRGVNPQGKPDPGYSATYQFLINPETLQINRSTVDQQSLTRGGWQFGVWGEDMQQISMQGQTAGQYWTYGLTDKFHQFTESYRNLQQLLMVFENNGYFFEGEQAGQGPLAADFTRRRIKMHQDVELIVGNFVWSGMFDSMNITDSADHSYNYNFSLVFTAWKERFRSGSPYNDTLHNDVQRGHSYSSYQGAQQLAAITAQATALPLTSLPYVPPPSITPLPPNGGPQSPAVASSQQEDATVNVDSTAYVTGYNSGTAFLNGVISPFFTATP